MSGTAVDVVVIGAGLGGLGAAVTLAQQGKSVLVLEHADQPGGYAVVFERPPFRFDASLHELDGYALGSGEHALLHQLGIADKVQLSRLDPLYAVRSADGDVVVPAEFHHYEAALEELFPSERSGIRAWLDDARGQVIDFERFQRDLRAKQMHPESMAQDYPTMIRQIGQTWQEATDAHISDPRLACLLTILWTYTATPPSRLSAALGMNLAGRYGTSGGWYPKGAAAAIPNALADALSASGGRIEYGETVSAIHSEDGLAVAVSTESGRTVPTRSVISNAAAPLLPDLLGAGVLPEEFVGRVTGPPAAISNVGVYLGLDADVMGDLGLPHEVFLVGEYDTEAAVAAALAGDWRRGGLVVTNYTCVDPGCAPPGGGVVAVMGAASMEYADTWGTAPGATESPGAVKERVGDALVAAAEEWIPGLAAATVLREVATPVTNQRYTLNPGGSWAGYDHTVADIMSPLGSTTPVPNLFQAGAWTGGFGETTALQSGMQAAQHAARYLDGIAG